MSENSKQEIQSQCARPSSPNAAEILDMLESHDWEIRNFQRVAGLGSILRFKCPLCNLEWSSIIAEESEKEIGSSKFLDRDGRFSAKTKPRFEY